MSVNALYNKGKERMLRGQVNFDTADIRAMLVTTGYNFNATHEFLNIVEAFRAPGTTDIVMTGKTTTDGVFDADDVNFAAVPAGSTLRGVVLYVNTGNPATSPLLHFVGLIAGFPLASNGAEILVRWSNGSFRIFSL